jgi:predicted RND superfamily exporter protein
MVVVDWNLGVIESIVTVLVVGFSVDYTVHLAEAYLASKGKTRHDKVTDAVTMMGGSIISGAFSTIGGAEYIYFSIYQ